VAAHTDSASVRQRVVVVGSYNTDMVIRTSRLPRPGETVIGGTFHSGPGGKGGNQAVAAARVGARVELVARVGMDALGSEALARLQVEQVGTDYVWRDETEATGTAWIIVDDQGENSIVVASGANAHLSVGDVVAAEPVIAAADVLLMQLECPLETLRAALEIARQNRVRVILNPAPAAPLNPEFLENVTIITPNEVEAEMLTGVAITSDAALQRAAGILLDRGIQAAMITLGSKGIYVAARGTQYLLPAFPVAAVDTTGAGDVFNGCLAAFCQPGRSLTDAVRMASAAAALSVTRLGAQDSAPSLPAVMQFMEQHTLAVSG
jgi:ribokinase